MIDYAYYCDKQGNLKCYNTHFSNDPNDWTVVHNMSNCEGTDKPACSGQPMSKKPRNIMATSKSASKKVQSIFDYVIKSAVNGQVKYYGAIVEGDREMRTSIPAAMYMKMTGKPNVYSTPGVFRFYRAAKRGSDLISYTKRIGQEQGYSKAVVDQVLKLLSKKGMFQTAKMYLEWKDIPVKDINDPYEIFLKYVAYNPHYSIHISEGDYNLMIGKHVSGINVKSASASGGGSSSGGFDWSGMMAGAMGLLSSGLSAGQSVQNAQALANWVAAFQNYMDIDFGDIRRELNEKGAAAALTWLLRLKETSWQHLKDYNIDWCNDYDFEIPKKVLDLQQDQIDLENDLKRQIEAGGGGGSPGAGSDSMPEYSSGNSGGAARPPVAPRGNAPGEGGSKTVLIVAGLILAVILANN